MLIHRELTSAIIRLAIDFHRHVGPGLLESVYERCLCVELEDAGIPFKTQVTVPVIYKGRHIPLGFRADILVDGKVIVEAKAIAALLPNHETQLMTYLRMSQIRVGLLMNFHAPTLRQGLRRFVV
jgi:GxxExxY protein